MRVSVRAGARLRARVWARARFSAINPNPNPNPNPDPNPNPKAAALSTLSACGPHGGTWEAVSDEAIELAWARHLQRAEAAEASLLAGVLQVASLALVRVSNPNPNHNPNPNTILTLP